MQYLDGLRGGLLLRGREELGKIKRLLDYRIVLEVDLSISVILIQTIDINIDTSLRLLSIGDLFALKP